MTEQNPSRSPRQPGFGSRSRLRHDADPIRGVLRIVNRPPARTDLAKPFSGVESLVPGDGSGQLEVQPAGVGTNDIHVYALTASSAPDRSPTTTAASGTTSPTDEPASGTSPVVNAAGGDLAGAAIAAVIATNRRKTGPE